jgi:hypothetical protein
MASNRVISTQLLKKAVVICYPGALAKSYKALASNDIEVFYTQ